MDNRISVGTQQAIILWQRNLKSSASKCAAIAGISHTTLLRAIKRLKLKRKKTLA
jgi:phage regulator Rha-like protein